MDRRIELAQFLRSRRARLTPADVGLVAYGRRRVPGLRREELAQLAGVSIDHYVRLEQGRNPHVSGEVLDSIARALRLDADETRHLHNLARPDRTRRFANGAPDVRPSTQLVLDSFDGPAYVVGLDTEVLAWNDLALAVFAEFATMLPEERNIALLIFLDPDYRALFGKSLAQKAADTVAFLHLNVGRHPDDPRLVELVGRLSVKSQEFRTLWAQQDVHDKSYGSYQLNHPLVGELELHYEAFRITNGGNQVMVTYAAEPGTSSADALQLIGSWFPDPD